MLKQSMLWHTIMDAAALATRKVDATALATCKVDDAAFNFECRGIQRFTDWLLAYFSPNFEKLPFNIEKRF